MKSFARKRRIWGAPKEFQMSQIVKSANEQGAGARRERFVTQGRVVAVDTVVHTARVDANLQDAQGAAVYLEGVPFSPQSPPTVGDGVTLAYTNASAHSVYIAGGRLGGGNTQGTITTVGGVTSVAKSGATKITGDVVLTAGTNCALVQAGSQITINVSVPTPGVSLEVDGASATAAPRGLVNVITGKGMQIAITDVPASNRVDLTLNAVFGTITPTKIAVGASPYSVAGGDFNVFCDTTGGAIVVTLPAPAATVGRLIVLMNVGAPGNAINVGSAAGSVVGIATITNALATTRASAWYISDGVNWYSITYSGSGAATAGVTSVNTLSGALTLAAGANVTLSTSGSTITINSAGAAGATGPAGPAGPIGATGPAGASGASVPTNVLVISPGAAAISWAVPVALTEFNGQRLYRARNDLTNATQARLLLYNANLAVLINPTLVAKYSTNGGSTWNYLDGATGPSLTYAGNEQNSGWVTLTAGAKTDVLLGIFASGGDGSTVCNFGTIYLQVK
jgi:hypothetical protein